MWGMLKSHQLGVASHRRGTLSIEKAGSHYVILPYCESSWVCKRFYQIPLHYITVVLCLRLTRPKVQLKVS